MCCRES